MPDCPNCGTWNPDDKTLCWRCQSELPKPVPTKPKRANFLGLPTWAWVVLVLFFVMTTFGQCLFIGGPPV
jgi:hypothetical protein